ncbi:DUF4856 domain-containing protein [Weeksellaceae bacterium TAE3-ERU29]|nr:DUF4856 domain-containing protein [Weeksellaceae bacterium TAE3-ERU29]
MKKVLVYASALALMGTVFTGCNNNDDDELVVVETLDKNLNKYEFTKNGESTVMYDGQNTRLAMLKDIIDALGNKSNSVAQLEGMFAHTEGSNDFSSAELNASNKNVKSKIASSTGLFDGGNSDLSKKIKAQFSGFLKTQADVVFPRWNEDASAGVAGFINDGKKDRRITAKGYEIEQMFKKGTIGALILDQSLNNYLVQTKKDNNNANMSGANYTEMEHHWDEAYGYMFGGTKNAVVSIKEDGSFEAGNEFAKYVNRVNSNSNFNGIAKKIFQAYVDGRQAIVEKKYTIRDKNIRIIQENASKVVAVRGVHYLLEGADEIKKGTRQLGFHAFSEGLGFVYSLQFTHNPATGKPYFSHEEVTNMLDNGLLKGNGLWTVSEEDVLKVAQEIANRFGFTLEQAKE